jgi:hypothetical protein
VEGKKYCSNFSSWSLNVPLLFGLSTPVMEIFPEPLQQETFDDPAQAKFVCFLQNLWDLIKKRANPTKRRALADFPNCGIINR